MGGAALCAHDAELERRGATVFDRFSKAVQYPPTITLLDLAQQCGRLDAAAVRVETKHGAKRRGGKNQPGTRAPVPSADACRLLSVKQPGCSPGQVDHLAGNFGKTVKLLRAFSINQARVGIRKPDAPDQRAGLKPQRAVRQKFHPKACHCRRDLCQSLILPSPLS